MEDLKQWYEKINAKNGQKYHKPTDPQTSSIPHPGDAGAAASGSTGVIQLFQRDEIIKSCFNTTNIF